MPRKTKDEEVIKKDKKKTTKTSVTNLVEVVKNAVTPQKESKSKKSTSSKKVAIEVEKNSTSIKKSQKTSASKSEVKKAASKSASSKQKTPAKVATSSKKLSTPETSPSSKAPIKKESTSKTSKKSTTTKDIKKTSEKASKKTTPKSSTKKTTTKKSTSPKTTAKSSTTKKSTTKRTTSKKSVAVATTEYYDLPATYNRTIVKILAQTPSSLFVYWEISEEDRIKLQQQYGEEFFKNTRPYLIINNETMNYSFEAEISDYANSWYIHIHDSNCKYTVQLIRKPINNQVSIPTSFVDITSSNRMSIPNDHILFDKLGKTVFFRNVTSNHVIEKDISSLSFISNIGKIYNVYDLYKEIYKNELNGDEFGMGLSSSGFSSTFK